MSDDTNNDDRGRGGARGGGIGPLPVLIIALLTVLAFFAGRYSGGHERHEYEKFVDGKEAREAADKVIGEAQARGKWDSQSETVLNRAMTQLSPRTRLQLASKVAQLVNGGKMRLELHPGSHFCDSQNPCDLAKQPGEGAGAAPAPDSGGRQAPGTQRTKAQAP